MNSKLSMKKAHRKSLERNLITSLVLFESIKTTKERGVILQSKFDKLLGASKKSDLNARKCAARILYDKKAIKKLFEQLVPRYENKNPSFVKVYKLSPRLGDNADMVLLELLDKKVFKKYLNSEKSSENKNKEADKFSQ
jgi:large subunit ribosomal protein L17